MYDEKDKKFLKTLKDQGVGPEEAFDRLNKVKSQMQGSAQKPPQQTQPKEPDYWGKGIVDFGKGVGQLGANAAAKVGEGIGNAANFAGQAASFLDPVANANRFTKTITGKDLGYKSPIEQIGGAIQTGTKMLADNARNTSSKISGVEQNSGWAQGGDLLGTGANIIAGSALGGSLFGNAGKAKDAATAGTAVAEEASKALLPKIANFVGNSLASSQGATAVNEGRFSAPEELGLGLALDTGFAGLGKLGEKLGDFAYSRLVPSTPKQLGKDISKGFDLGESLSKEVGIAGSQKAVEKKLGEAISKYTGQLDDAIKNADTNSILQTGEKLGFKAKDLLGDDITKEVLKNSKLKLKFGDSKSVNNAIQSVLDDFYEIVGDRTLQLADVQDLKKKLGSSLSGFFAKSGDSAATAKELVNDIIRKNAKKIVEENVKGSKNLNKVMAPLIEAQKRIASKGPYSGYLTDLLAGGYFGGGPEKAFTDPVQFLSDAAKGIVLKRAGTSTLAKSLTGSALKNSSKFIPILSNLAKGATNKLTSQNANN